jgi:PiT family inorganic phosphate transporter
MLATIVAIIVLALLASFLTGIHDSSNIATMISSRALPPRTALVTTAIAEFVGPLIFGVGVAKTIGINVVSPQAINLLVLLAALISAVFWILLTWWLRIPSSYTHALVGGFIGSVVVEAGWQALQVQGIVSILVGLFLAPVVGFVFSWLLLYFVFLLSWNATPRINVLFKRSQLVSVIAMALGQGTNDSAKSMGIITLALVIAGHLHVFYVPLWVILICSAALALGTGLGGMRLIRTVGGKIYKVRISAGFCASDYQRQSGGISGEHYPGGEFFSHWCWRG